MSQIHRGNGFDVEDHYGAYLNKETLRSISQPFMLTNKAISIPQRKQNISIRKLERARIRYKDFLDINGMFEAYLDKLKGTMGASNFICRLYMAELTGAMVRMVPGGSGIVVEERMNSIIVVLEDDAVKTYLKRSNDFIIRHDGIDYIFIGSRMKTNRFTKK